MKDGQKINQKETLIKVLRYIRPYSLLMVITIVMAAISVAVVQEVVSRAFLTPVFSSIQELHFFV